MLFSPTAKHAIRALIHLATREGEGPVLGREIARLENVPKPFLSKILHDLRTKNLVKTRKGPGGGYELARPARDIRVIEVVNAIDGDLDFENACILGLDRCDPENQCALHDQWSQFRDEYFTTLSDLALSDAAEMLLRKRGGILDK